MSLTVIDTNNIYHRDVIGNVRTAQEDSHDIAALTPNGDVFVVCDGMGGHVGGKQASSIAVKSIIEYLKLQQYPDPIKALRDALQFANVQILGYSNEKPELKGMGTTACIVLLQKSEAYIAHVGDSRIYLYLGKEKQLHRVTKDHSYVQTLVDAGEITDDEAENHPNKNRILKALGIKPDIEPTFGKVTPKNGDVFLICSDGLSGMVTDSTIKDVMTQNISIEQKGETLINLALEAGGVDNITLELIQIANSPHTKSVYPDFNPRAKKTPRPKRWKFILPIAIVVIIAAIATALFLFKDRGKDVEAKIAAIDNKVTELNNDISRLNTEETALKLEFETELAKIKDDTARKLLKKSYDKRSRAHEIAAKNSEIAVLQAQRDSLTSLLKSENGQSSSRKKTKKSTNNSPTKK